MTSMNSGVLAGRLPCHEYITCRFDAGSLGLEIRPIDPANDPVLGHAIISRVVPGGQADRERVQALDCIVSVNGEYTAFLSFVAIGEKLRSGTRPLIVLLARPWKSAWERIGGDIEAVVKTGNLDKLSVGLLSRWQAREFVLSRTTLSYSEEGVLRKKIPLEEIISVLPTTSDTEFILHYQGREVHMRSQSAEDKLMWLHALESTKKGCFDNVQRILTQVESSRPNTASSTPVPPSGLRPSPPPSANRGPYAMLNKSLVIVRTSTTENGVASYTLPPPVIVPSFQPIDLSVERIVLGRG